MAANSKNNNGSDWVTARHGGTGKGKMSASGAPATVNHHGAVNGKKGPVEGSPEEEATESPEQEKSEEGGSRIPGYITSIADKLRTHHGLTHTHSMRIAAGITKKHADGHASVDSKTQMAAKAAHDELQGTLKKHGTTTKAAVGSKK